MYACYLGNSRGEKGWSEKKKERVTDFPAWSAYKDPWWMDGRLIIELVCIIQRLKIQQYIIRSIFPKRRLQTYPIALIYCLIYIYI